MNRILSRSALLLALGLLTTLCTDLAPAARVQTVLTPGFQYEYRGAVREIVTLYKGNPDSKINIDRAQTHATVVNLPSGVLASTTNTDSRNRTVTLFNQKLRIVSTFDAASCERQTITYSERETRFESRRCDPVGRPVWKLLSDTADHVGPKWTTITAWSTDGRHATSTETLKIPGITTVLPSSITTTELLFNVHDDLEQSIERNADLPGRTTTTTISYTYDVHGNWTSRSKAMRTVNLNVASDNTTYPTLTEKRRLTYWQ